MIRKVEYQGFSNCIEISSERAGVIVSTDFGPRILLYALDGGDNILGWHGQAAVHTELGMWKPYGGHRLWVAPENMPLSYAPDNGPVEYQKLSDRSASFRAAADAAGFQKEMTVALDEKRVTIDHRLTNRTNETREISAWCLTIMRPGGEAVIPNEPFAPYSANTLLAVRTMTFWSYTDLTDPRWRFEKEFIGLRCDPEIPHQQKFGMLNRQGWAAYRWGGLRFEKRFEFFENAEYPDMNSNTEIYTAGDFIEVETLSQLKALEPGEAIDYHETWDLSNE